MARPPHSVWAKTGGIYQEEVSGRFYRVAKLGADILVLSYEDHSPMQTQRYLECWACAKRVPHSSDFHHATLRQAGRRYMSVREDDDGRQLTTWHEDAVTGWDE